jgi:PAS domain S-box-containing protein
MSDAPPATVRLRPDPAPPQLAPALAALPVAVLLLDRDAMILHANPSATALLDLPGARSGRLSPFLRLAAGSQDFLDLTDAAARVAPGADVRLGPVHLRTATGRAVVADVHLSLHDAALRRTVAVVIDRTGWAEAESAMQAAREQLQARQRHVELLMTAARLGASMVVVCDASQRVEWINAAFESETGWTLEELRNRRLSVLQGAQTSDDAIATMRQALSAGEGFTRVELLNYRRDGQPYWAEVSVEPVRNADGRIDGYVGVAHNIDARRRAEIELAEREGILRGVFAAAPDAALVVRRDGTVAKANHHARELLALGDPQAAAGMPLRARLADEDRAAFDAAFQRALFGTPQTLDVSTLAGCACSAKLWPLWRRADTHAVLVVLVDQTELRAAEDRRRIVEATAAANQLRSEFLSRVSHELRTPLNAILGFAQLLGVGSRAERAEMVEHIMHAGRHLLALIDDVLDLSSAASGELRVSLADQQLVPVLLEVAGLQRQSAQQARVVIEIDAQERALAVRADPVRLRQVLANLVSNAVKYNVPGGRVVVSATRQQDGRIEIAVVDTGVGMTPAQQQALFQPFNRLGAEKRRISGTGIGLVITQSLVKAMGGQLTVASEPGRGSRFAFTLAAAAPGTPGKPLAPTLPVLAGTDRSWADELPSTVAAPFAGDEGEAREVLYIEDEPTNALLVSAALRTIPGVRLRVAPTIGEGVLAFAARPAQLVLLDMHLPDGHGLQALDQLRRLPNWDRPPVVALSADAERRHIAEALAAGVDDYVTKPVVVSALLDTVRRLLQRVRATAG